MKKVRNGIQRAALKIIVNDLMMDHTHFVGVYDVWEDEDGENEKEIEEQIEVLRLELAKLLT